MYIVYRYTSTSMYTGLATVVVFYWGHCECLASLVGTVRVLSAVMFL